MGEEGSVAVAAELLGAEEGEDDGASWPRAGGEDVGEGENGGCAGGVVVGAVVVGVACCVGWADAEVVKVRGEEDHLVRLWSRGGCRWRSRSPCEGCSGRRRCAAGFSRATDREAETSG